ncbi:MAG: trypsin-like peptidase domain-containing protein [Planctomycetota bacterium]
MRAQARFDLMAVVFSSGLLAAGNVAATGVASAQGADVAQDAGAAHQSLADSERNARSIYARVASAVVRVRYNDASNGLVLSHGVLVSSTGELLVSGPVPAGEIEVRLADGRPVRAARLHWSKDRGYGLARLAEPGPWPHVSVGGSAPLVAGQPLLVLRHPLNKSGEHLDRPLPSIEFVDGAAAGHWFVTNGVFLGSYLRPVAFDLSGRLVGLASFSSGQRDFGWGFASTTDIESTLNTLRDGKRVDLGPIENDQPRDAKEPPPISEEAKKRATAASVRIRRTQASEQSWQNQMRVSGTVIRRDGLIATCAHHFFMPGTAVTVSFPDGRDLAGEVLGLQFPTDVGLVQLRPEDGPFEYVETGNTAQSRPGDHCFALGFGGLPLSEHDPSMHEGRIAHGNERASFSVFSSTPMVGGDSGGGLFDSRGRLIGIHIRHSDDASEHTRIELIERLSKGLRASFRERSTPHAHAIEAALDKASAEALGAVVSILAEDEPVALGTLVGPRLLVTKASTLPAAPRCRLPDGREVAARVLVRIRGHDLAVLRIDDQVPSFLKLEDARYSAVGSVVGSLVATATGDPKPAIGCIAVPQRSYDRERGFLRVHLEDGLHGPRVTEVVEFSPFDGVQDLASGMLETGDIIQGLEGRPTPTAKSCWALLSDSNDDLDVNAGDTVALDIIREGRTMTVLQQLAPAFYPHPAGQSLRYTGFRDAFGIMTSSNASLCGGPVVDREGRLLGIAIAWHRPGWLLVLPADVVKQVVDMANPHDP